METELAQIRENKRNLEILIAKYLSAFEENNSISISSLYHNMLDISTCSDNRKIHKHSITINIQL